MWIENIRTGKKWFVAEELGKRLLRYEDYIELVILDQNPKAPAKKKTGE